ncbi:hypothetical protein [Gordonia shandongensis]|uniref:Rv1157c family protein n=1 Tax=Gordonia shandongensis TaxID=376351 RepID=UPI000419E65A|nr:hypothetical protein [Gordonia shandongensis]
MRLARSRRAAAAVAAAALLAPAFISPATAHAAPADSGDQSQDLPIPDAEDAPEVEPRVLESLGALTPALIGSVATRDDDGKVNDDLIKQVRALADNPAVPAEAEKVWNSLLDFIGEPGAERAARTHAADDAALAARTDPGKRDAAKKKDGPSIPSGPGKPRIQQFLYPTLGFGCMAGGGNSVGMALATAGPQKAPAPGPKRGQAGYVYTSLGTGAAKNSGQKLWVSWLNIDNGRTGQTALKPNPKINATKGPGTFTAIANTGRGRIVSTIYGTVTTKSKGRTVSCTIAPTVGTAII